MKNLRRKINTMLHTPRIIWIKFASTKLFELLPDKIAISIMYQNVFNKKINLKNPTTFNEKLQWLKLYWRDDRAPICADKYSVREYLKERGYGYLLNELIGVYDAAEEIDFESLPDSFVLKCTHGSACNIICPDKSKLDKKDAVKKLNKWLKTDYYIKSREWPYKYIKPRIICEKYLGDINNVPVDYKFFCYNGRVDCVMLCLDRITDKPRFYFFNSNWQLRRYNIAGKQASDNFCIPRPEKICEMFEISKCLSDGYPFVRVDLYYCEEKIYFGEMTFFPSGGLDANLLEETDVYFGNLINLEGVKK